MSNETFTRENRYEVIKVRTGKKVEAVVIEKGWPEYELVWQMLENRVVGNADRVLEDKEREFAELNQMYRGVKKLLEFNTQKNPLLNQIAELQTHINDLREALEYWSKVINYQYSGSKEAISFLQQADDVAQQALSKTPAQSLIEHDNEVK